MLNLIWGFMIIIGIAYGAITGNMQQVSNAALDSAKEAVSLCITMVGVMSLWTGLMEVAQSAGVMGQLTKLLKPAIKFLFPRIPEGHSANTHITANIVANILGLGWAATPAGLRAMKSLSELNSRAGIASIEMCTFLIVNISSLQLIPVNMIAYRSQYGSVNPSSIVAPTIIATLISTIAGVAFAKIMERKNR